MQVTISEGEREWLGPVSCYALLRWSVNRTHWSVISKVLRSSSLMKPCSAWGRNVVSKPVSQAAYCCKGSALYVYLLQSNECGTRLLVA